jgi:hypothetical protein
MPQRSRAPASSAHYRLRSLRQPHAALPCGSCESHRRSARAPRRIPRRSAAETRRTGLEIGHFAQPGPGRKIALVWRRRSTVSGPLFEPTRLAQPPDFRSKCEHADDEGAGGRCVAWDGYRVRGLQRQNHERLRPHGGRCRKHRATVRDGRNGLGRNDLGRKDLRGKGIWGKGIWGHTHCRCRRWRPGQSERRRGLGRFGSGHGQHRGRRLDRW